MKEIKITLDTTEIQKVSDEIGPNLKKFNESKIGPYEFKTFSIYVVDDQKCIIGGIKGDFFDQICRVFTVWVHEKERKQGLGSELFKKLDVFAKENHCVFIQLDTAEFQAKGFYEKMGYSVVATLPNSFKNYTSYILRKYL